MINNRLTKRSLTTLCPLFSTIIDIIRKNLIHMVLPTLLMLLSKYNERYYLQPDHLSLAPLYLIRIIVFITGLWVSISLINPIIKLKRHALVFSPEQKSFFGIFMVLLAWYGSWLIIYYPGSYTTDTLDAIRQISFMELNDWFSYLHPLTYLLLYQFYPHIIIIGVAQCLLFAFVFADITNFIYNKLEIKTKWKISGLIIFLIFLLSITSFTYYSFFYMRDIPYSLLHLYFAFYIYKCSLNAKQKEFSLKQLIILLSLGLILSIYRGEGWVILFTGIFVLFIYGKLSRTLVIRAFSIAFAGFLFLEFILPKIINVYPSDKNHYKLTLIAYPLGFILNQGRHAVFSNYENDIAKLSKVVNIEKIKENTNCYNISEFQHGKNNWHSNASPEEWAHFFTTTYQIFLKNPHFFLAARTANFTGQLIGFEGRTERTNDQGRNEFTYDECKNNKNNVWCQEFCGEKMFRILSAIPSCKENNGVCGLFNLMKLSKFEMDWHWNSTFAFIFSFIVLFLYKYFPISAMSSAVILSRVPLVFLTAPYGFFRYVFSLYLFGIFILLFVLLEWRSKNQNFKASSAN